MKKLIVLLFIMFGVCIAIYTNLIMVCIADYTTPNYSLFRQERLVNLGEFELTAYCPCEICTGKSIGDIGYQVTALGTIAFEGYTIATDTSILPFNSKVSLGKYGSSFIAQDTGSAIKGNRIDIYFNDHQDALNFGRQEVIVYWILERGEN